MSTTLSLILIAGLVLIVQTAQLQDSRLAREVAGRQQRALDREALLVLLRPKIGEFFYGAGGDSGLVLDGESAPIEYRGWRVGVLLDVLRSAGTDTEGRLLPSLLSVVVRQVSGERPI